MKQKTASKKEVSSLEEKNRLSLLVSNLLENYHYINIPSVGDVSKEFGVSPTKFNYFFKNLYGDNYYTYFLKHKLKYAEKMLKYGLTLKEVSGTLGYSHPTKFLMVFKKYYGLTTRGFKKSVLE